MQEPIVPIKPVTLRGVHATLEPLAASHADDLRHAVADGQLWKLWYTVIPTPDRMADEIERRLALQERGLMQPFAVRRNDTGAVCGMTTYMDIDALNRRLEIGSTWTAASAQRSGINTECKLMLLDTCLRDTGMHRGRVPHALDESPIARRHRPPRRQARRRTARASPHARWQPARHRRIFHHRAGMADGAFASAVQAGTPACMRYCRPSRHGVSNDDLRKHP